MEQSDGGQTHDGDDFPVFVGVARTEQGTKAVTLEDAIEAAYEKGKASGRNRFRVLEIVVTGDNPINEYKVVLGPAG